MIYQAYGAQANFLDLVRPLAASAGTMLRLSWPLLRQGWPLCKLAGALETFANLTVTHVRLPFGIETAAVGDRLVPVTEEAVYSTPFATLLHFKSKLAVIFASASILTALAGIAVDVISMFMALLSSRGISTPSLQAQGEQRRSSYFNNHRIFLFVIRVLRLDFDRRLMLQFRGFRGHCNAAGSIGGMGGRNGVARERPMA